MKEFGYLGAINAAVPTSHHPLQNTAGQEPLGSLSLQNAAVGRIYFEPRIKLTAADVLKSKLVSVTFPKKKPQPESRSKSSTHQVLETAPDTELNHVGVRQPRIGPFQQPDERRNRDTITVTASKIRERKKNKTRCVHTFRVASVRYHPAESPDSLKR